jgi:hypothetical protein
MVDNAVSREPVEPPMTVRAFECRAPRTGQVIGFVSLSRLEDWSPEVRIVRLRVGADWRCALLDRSRVVEVDGMLLRDAVASDERDCPECAPRPAAAVTESAPEPEGRASPHMVRAAAISLQGVPMVVVLVRRDLVDSPGEASMLQDVLRPRFGGAAVVLMGQDDDGTAHYYGDPALVELLDGVPVERMPWKAHPLG